MLLHAHFVLIRCVLNHLGVGREGMKRRQDCQDGDSGAIRLANAMPCWTAFPASSDPSAPGLPQARGGHTQTAISGISRRPRCDLASRPAFRRARGRPRVR